MTVRQKKRFVCAAAYLLAAALPFGMYFGARALSDVRFDDALHAMTDAEPEHREGLWHFNSLDARTQQLYTVLYDAMDARRTETERVSFVPTEEEFSAAFDAVLSDHPLFCDLVREECTMRTTAYSAAVTLSYMPSGDARREALVRTADALLRSVSLLDKSTAAQQLHDMLVRTCTYTEAPGTAYNALVCCASDSSGYALAYTYLCREAGIDCAVVNGSVSVGDVVGEHAWNVLTLDGETGYTDASWNDTAFAGAENFIPLHGYYFLSSDEIMADHIAGSDPAPKAMGDTQSYYEKKNLRISAGEEPEPFLIALLAEARRVGSRFVEFQYPADGKDLHGVIAAAIDAVNADAAMTAPRLRSEYKCYAASPAGGMTVQLFYEE